MKNLILNEKELRKKMIDSDIKTINELAAKAGVSKPTIYEYINGKSPLSPAFVLLCAYLNADPHEILIETEAAFAEDENVQTSY